MSDIELRQTNDGVVLPVIAQPGAKRDGISGVHDGRMKVAVRQVAEGGKANKALLKLLAKELGIKANQLSLSSGMTSRRKEILVTGLSLSELRSKLPQ